VIAAKLQAEGVSISRRTIAKYASSSTSRPPVSAAISESRLLANAANSELHTRSPIRVFAISEAQCAS